MTVATDASAAASAASPWHGLVLAHLLAVPLLSLGLWLWWADPPGPRCPSDPCRVVVLRPSAAGYAVVRSPPPAAAAAMRYDPDDPTRWRRWGAVLATLAACSLAAAWGAAAWVRWLRRRRDAPAPVVPLPAAWIASGRATPAFDRPYHTF